MLTAAQQRNLASPYRLLLQHGWRWDHLDADLIEAIRAVLERRGHPAGERIDNLLLEHLAIREEGTELLDAIYLWEPLERLIPEVMEFEDLSRPDHVPFAVAGVLVLSDLRRGAGPGDRDDRPAVRARIPPPRR